RCVEGDPPRHAHPARRFASHPARTLRGGTYGWRRPVATVLAHYATLAAASPDHGIYHPRCRRLPHLCPTPGAGRTPSARAVNLCLCRVSRVRQPAYLSGQQYALAADDFTDGGDVSAARRA